MASLVAESAAPRGTMSRLLRALSPVATLATVCSPAYADYVTTVIGTIGSGYDYTGIFGGTQETTPTCPAKPSR
jgi:hypothetical protein